MVAPPTSRHTGGVNVMLADGSVRFVAASVDQTTWTAVGTAPAAKPSPSPDPTGRTIP